MAAFVGGVQHVEPAQGPVLCQFRRADKIAAAIGFDFSEMKQLA